MSATSTFAVECLDAHNRKRFIHGAPKLQLNDEISGIAQRWAEELLRRGFLKHSSNRYQGKPLGENLASKTSTYSVLTYTGAEATEQWYAESEHYNYQNHSFGIKTGHFSQLVWKNSRELGVGVAVSNGRCVVVANYYPAGNHVGEFKANVLPAQYSEPVDENNNTLLSGAECSRNHLDAEENFTETPDEDSYFPPWDGYRYFGVDCPYPHWWLA